MRKPKESGIDYKKRIIDRISDSFCAAKWYNATIWLGHGDTTSCHHPPGHKIDVEEIKTNPSAIHNTKHKKLMRKYMLEGTRPKECEYCWKVEDMGKDAISDRVYKTEIYKDKDIKDIPKLHGSTENVNLKTLEIAFDRTCQFSCSYCNPAFSTTWVKDIRRYGSYKMIKSDGRGHFIDDAEYAKVVGVEYRKEEENPYIAAFWKWWDNGLADSLEELRVTGGEPTMSPELWKLFDWFKDNYGKSDMRFAINSNLGGKKELIDMLIEKSHHVKYFELYTSNESMFPQCEYIRDGLEWEYWEDNVNRLITDGHIYGLHMMMTINALCLVSIVEFFDWMLELKSRYGPRYPRFTCNILRFPSFQSALTLPKEIKNKFAKELEDWLDKVKDLDFEYKLKIDPWSKEVYKDGEKLLGPWEVDHVQRLIDYLREVDTPHLFTAERPKLKNDFKVFYEQYDKRRDKDFRKTFPSLVDWYDNLDLIGGDEIENRESGVSDKLYDVLKKIEHPNEVPWGEETTEKYIGGWNTETDSLGGEEV